MRIRHSCGHYHKYGTTPIFKGHVAAQPCPICQAATSSHTRRLNNRGAVADQHFAKLDWTGFIDFSSWDVCANCWKRWVIKDDQRFLFIVQFKPDTDEVIDTKFCPDE